MLTVVTDGMAERGSGVYSDIAQKLCVNKLTVSRTVHLFCANGSVAKKSYPEGMAFCKMTSPAQLLILHL